MPSPLVSVVIPAFNAGRTIDRALASVFAQDYQPLDIIVVNDGSTDDTSERVARYPEAVVRLLHLAQNRGVAAATNAGLAVARGQFIAFLDADDEWLRGKLQYQVTQIEANPDMSFVCSGWREVDLSGHAGPLPDLGLWLAATRPNLARTAGAGFHSEVHSACPRGPSKRGRLLRRNPARGGRPGYVDQARAGWPSWLAWGAACGPLPDPAQSHSTLQVYRQGLCPSHGRKARSRPTGRSCSRRDPPDLRDALCSGRPVAVPRTPLHRRTILSLPCSAARSAAGNALQIHRDSISASGLVEGRRARFVEPARPSPEETL